MIICDIFLVDILVFGCVSCFGSLDGVLKGLNQRKQKMKKKQKQEKRRRRGCSIKASCIIESNSSMYDESNQGFIAWNSF